MIPKIIRKDKPPMEKEVPKQTSVPKLTIRWNDLRYRVVGGTGGFCIYDYLLYSLPKKDGKYLCFPTLAEADRELATFPREILPYCK